MNEPSKMQENYFAWQHLRLLNIATWAKNLAWVVLAVFILSGGAQALQFASQFAQNQYDSAWNNLAHQAILGTNVAATVLSGVVYYLILQGVSLGLNMIVETDVNYRDGKQYEEMR